MPLNKISSKTMKKSICSSMREVDSTFRLTSFDGTKRLKGGVVLHSSTTSHLISNLDLISLFLSYH